MRTTTSDSPRKERASKKGVLRKGEKGTRNYNVYAPFWADRRSFENNVSPSIPVSTLDRCSLRVYTALSTTYAYVFRFFINVVRYFMQLLRLFRWFTFVLFTSIELDHGTRSHWRPVMMVTTVTNGSKTRDNMKISRIVRVTVPAREPQRTTHKAYNECTVRSTCYLRKFVTEQSEFRRESNYRTIHAGRP